MGHGREGLELVDLLGRHGVDLLQGDDDVLGEHQVVVLRQLVAVVFRGAIATQMGRQDVQHEGGLVGTLTTDEGKNLMVHLRVVHHRCHHGQEPATRVEILVGKKSSNT